MNSPSTVTPLMTLLAAHRIRRDQVVNHIVGNPTIVGALKTIADYRGVDPADQLHAALAHNVLVAVGLRDPGSPPDISPVGIVSSINLDLVDENNCTIEIHTTLDQARRAPLFRRVQLIPVDDDHDDPADRSAA